MRTVGRIFALWCAVAAALFASTDTAVAQTVRQVEVAVDNDALLFWLRPWELPDHNYTHGMHISLEMDGAPLWGRLARHIQPCAVSEDPAQPCLATAFEIGQEIYTPQVNSSVPIPGERPYAGWLYGAATATADGPHRQQSLRVELGVTGPPSLAETFQVELHKAMNFWRPLGWRHQIPFEPAILIRYNQSQLFETRHNGIRIADLVPQWGASIGSVLTGAHAGAQARLGYGLRHPWHASDSENRPLFGAYVLGGVRQSLVLHNLFLDGSTFGESPRAEKLPWVREYQVGLGLQIESVVIEYRVVRQGREYRSQLVPHRYASLTATIQRSK